MRRELGCVLGSLFLSGLLFFPTEALADLEILGLRASGEGEVGGRIFVDRPSRADRAKFEEYRDIPPGLFLERLRLRLESEDQRYSLEFGAQDAGEEDQHFFLRGAKLGQYAFEFDWDQLPHVFSNTGRSPYRQTSRGVFELPDLLQTTLQGASAAARPGILQNFLATAPDTDLRTRWDTAHFLTQYTPTPDWDLRAEFTHQLKHGERPIGMVFGSPGGNLIELPERIDQTVDNFGVTAGLARERYQLQLSYHLSLFQNDVGALTADDPLRITDAPLSPAGTSAPARGRLSLAPDNLAHTASLTGGVTLPWRSRLTGTFAYGWRFQDQGFLPHTINAAIANPGLALPANSLDGDVRTLLANLRFTSRPWRDITVAARYRFYDFDDRTPSLVFPAEVVTDTTLNTESVASSRFSYTKHNAGADIGWRLLTPLSLKVGYEWERWDRDSRHREAPLTDEHTPKLSLDYTPLDWLLLRTSYAHSWRRISNYNTFAHLAHTVLEEESLQGEIPQAQDILLRKYDEADRDRDRADLLVQLTPVDTLTLTPNLSFRHDNYQNSPLGLQEDLSWAAGFDVTWSLMEGLALFASYMHEQYDARQRSRYREPPNQLENPTFDWVAKNLDIVDTVGAGIDAALIPKTLDLRLAWNFSTALGKMRAFNPVTPTGGTAAQNASATATNFPNITDRLHQLEASLKYQITPASYLRFRYIFEQFNITDFRTDNIEPFMGGTDIFLGAQIRDYTAHIFAITLGYRF
jgi:MtrB/PioB family decaheme-associated outer membrane protein